MSIDKRRAFSQYDVVRIRSFASPIRFDDGPPNQRQPQPGDIATIVEIYQQPPGYELECCDLAGITIWLESFAPEQIDMVVVTAAS